MCVTIADCCTSNNPFDLPGGDDPKQKWEVPPAAIEKFSGIFATLPLLDGMVSGADARQILLTTELSTGSRAWLIGAMFVLTHLPDQLREIWGLADFEKKGKLDREEFILCMFLCHLVKKGNKIPAVLPPGLIPPSKRG